MIKGLSIATLIARAWGLESIVRLFLSELEKLHKTPIESKVVESGIPPCAEVGVAYKDFAHVADCSEDHFGL